MKKYLSVILSIMMFFISTNIMAQSSRGDRLFLEGQKLQKTMTVASQNQAIKKFQQAKVAYTTTEKKDMCDNQISICNDNIKRIRQDAAAKHAKKKEEKEEPVDTVAAEQPVVEQPAVELSLSKSRLDFKANPKSGTTQSVKVNCNYDNWEVSAHPEWVTVYTAKDKISVEVEKNSSDEARSGIVTIKCGDKESSIVINQSQLKGFKKIIKKVSDAI